MITMALAKSLNAAEKIDHQIWQGILQQYVDNEGLVNYQALSKNREAFDQYVGVIETVSPATNPELFPSSAAELAYYINSYNVMVFNGVLDRGPEAQSVWRGLISGLNFFVRMDIIIGGEETNLKELEDDVIRDRYKDPRIHAALNCASIGCPRLIREPYEANKLEQQLDAAMIEFLNDPIHVSPDHNKQRVGLSKIFDWYESDFLDYETTQDNASGSTDSRLIDFVNRYRPVAAQIPNTYDVYILEYDKRINSQ